MPKATSNHLAWLKTESATPSPGVYCSLRELMTYRLKASGFSFLPKQPVHSVLAGRHSSRMRGRGLNFEEIRQYRFGDDIRAMDWRVTARTLEPHIRVYTEERDRPVFFVIDQRITMFFGSVVNMKSVTAAHATALGAWRSISQGDRVGGCVFSDRSVEGITPSQSPQKLQHLLGLLVRFNQDLHADQNELCDPEQLNQALAMAARELKHDGLCCVLTDGFGFDAETEKALSRLSAKNDVLWGHVFDPLESQLPATGKMVVADDTGQMQVTLSKKLQQAFSQQSADHFQQLEHTLKKLRIPILQLDTAHPVEEQIRDQLGYVPKAPRR